MQDSRSGSFGPGQAETTRSARSIAVWALAEHARRFPDLVPTPLETAGLDARDAALTHALHDAVIRRWLTLAAVLDGCLSQPFEELEPKMRAVLLVGAAQMLLMDRIPDHAAIDESVAWAKRHVRPKAGGLVNAVLREVQRRMLDVRPRWTDGRDEILLPSGAARGMAQVFLPEDPIDRLSRQVSLPTGVIRRWIDTRGVEPARAAAIATLCQPPVVLNTQFARGLPAGARAHASSGHAVFEGSPAELGAALGADAHLWVQDAASASAIRRVASRRPQLIVDLCAGRGTKTRQLAATFPEASIVAGDVDRARAKELARLFKGHARVEVMPVESIVLRVSGRADLVLLDVPCSNSGVLARRPEAKYRFGRDQTRRLAQIQRQLIADAVPMLSPTGAVLYSTCSLEPEEDAEPLAWAAEWHRFRITSSELLWPRTEPWADASSYADGAFSAVLER
jgi:16S rRNA (cytosine967-C5)-methyltransferase